MARILTLGADRPGTALLLAGSLVVAGLSALLGGVPFDNSVEAFLPRNDPARARLEAFRRVFPEQTLAVVEPGPGTDAVDLARRLRAVAGASRVDVVSGPEGGRAVVVHSDVEERAGKERLVKSLRREAGADASVAGPLVLEHDLDKSSSQALVRLAPIALAVVFVVVAIGLRSLVHAVAVLAAAGAAALFSLTLLVLSGAPLDLLTSTVPALVAVLSVSAGVHLACERSLARTRGSAAWRRALLRRAGPLFAASGTTALGFLALSASSVPPIRRFGLLAALGVLCGLSLQCLLLPALGVWMERRRGGAEPAREPSALRRALLRSVRRADLSHRRRGLVLVTALLVALAALAGARRIRLESNVLRFFPDDAPIVRATERIEHDLFGLTPVEIWVRTEPVSGGTTDVAPPLLRLAAARPALEGFVRRAFEVGGGDVTFALAPDPASPQGDRLRVVDGRAHARITLLCRTTSVQRSAALLDRLEEELPDLGPGTEASITGAVPLLLRMQAALPATQLRSFLASFLLVGLVLLYLLRSARLLVAGLVPNLLPILLLFGLMGFVGIPLDVATVTVAGIAFGLVVDDTIHLFLAWRGGRGRGRRAARLAWARVRRPVVLTSLATATGFLAFSFSPFRPTAFFGGLVAATALFALVADLLVFPALLGDPW